jgi:hypothetical protein
MVDVHIPTDGGELVHSLYQGSRATRALAILRPPRRWSPRSRPPARRLAGIPSRAASDSSRRPHLGGGDPLASKLATKLVGMHWINKAPHHAIPHATLWRQVVRLTGQFTRTAKLTHMVEQGRARRNTDQDTVWKISADLQHPAPHPSNRVLSTPMPLIRHRMPETLQQDNSSYVR